MPLFGDRPAYRPPGERWQYSNAGYVLLGIVLEHVTGRAYVDLVQERVFDRAGMTSTGFLRLDEPHPDVAVAYLDPEVPGGPRRTNIYSIPVIGGADGGALSTPRDLSRFLDRVADGSLMGPLTDVMLDPREDIGGELARVRLLPRRRGRVRPRWRRPRGVVRRGPLPGRGGEPRRPLQRGRLAGRAVRRGSADVALRLAS